MFSFPSLFNSLFPLLFLFRTLHLRLGKPSRFYRFDPPSALANRLLDQKNIGLHFGAIVGLGVQRISHLLVSGAGLVDPLLKVAFLRHLPVFPPLPLRNHQIQQMRFPFPKELLCQQDTKLVLAAWCGTCKIACDIALFHDLNFSWDTTVSLVPAGILSDHRIEGVYDSPVAAGRVCDFRCCNQLSHRPFPRGDHE